MATANKMKPYGLDGKRAVKPNLTEVDITQWKEVLLANIRADNEMKDALKYKEWDTSKKVNRGFTGTGADAKKATLERCLTFIATYAPVSLFSEIKYRKKKFEDIWDEINAWADVRPPSSARLTYYRLKQSYDSNGKTSIQEHYYNLRDSMESSFLKKEMFHNKEKTTEDEDFSPTAEATVVLDWMHSIGGNSLVEHVFRVFHTELETKSLKDIQRRISENMTNLLAQANHESEATAQVGRLSIRPNRRGNSPRNFDRNSDRGSRLSPPNRGRDVNPPRRQKSPHPNKFVTEGCVLCKAKGLPQASSHSIETCWGLSDKNRRNIVIPGGS